MRTFAVLALVASSFTGACADASLPPLDASHPASPRGAEAPFASGPPAAATPSVTATAAPMPEHHHHDGGER
jgi:hypothetical protein